jgi:hypothetical protein
MNKQNHINSGYTITWNAADYKAELHNDDDLDDVVNNLPLTAYARSEYRELKNDMIDLEESLHVYKFFTGALSIICGILFIVILTLI